MAERRSRDTGKRVRAPSPAPFFIGAKIHRRDAATGSRGPAASTQGRRPVEWEVREGSCEWRTPFAGYREAGSSPVARSIFCRSEIGSLYFREQLPLAWPLGEYRAAGAHMLMGEENCALPPDMAT